MSVSKWAYEETKCEGHYCPGDCDMCGIAEEDEVGEYVFDLEMGFDPYLGCYTDDC